MGKGRGGKGDGFFSPVGSNSLSRERLSAHLGVNDHLELLTIDYLSGRRGKVQRNAIRQGTKRTPKRYTR